MRLKMSRDKKITMIHYLFRSENPLTTKEIAEEFEVSQGTVARWKKYETMEMVAEYYRGKTLPHVVQEMAMRYQLPVETIRKIIMDADLKYF